MHKFVALLTGSFVILLNMRLETCVDRPPIHSFSRWHSHTLDLPHVIHLPICTSPYLIRLHSRSLFSAIIVGLTSFVCHFERRPALVDKAQSSFFSPSLTKNGEKCESSQAFGTAVGKPPVLCCVDSSFHLNPFMFHQKKTTTGGGTGASTMHTTPPSNKQSAAHAAAATSAKKSTKLKGTKGKKKMSLSSSGAAAGHVLGGADYVDILMGGRRRAREEAQKLPRDRDYSDEVAGAAESTHALSIS
jgi:hypothetical protein